jgi:hypothetical protein
MRFIIRGALALLFIKMHWPNVTELWLSGGRKCGAL